MVKVLNMVGDLFGPEHQKLFFFFLFFLGVAYFFYFYFLVWPTFLFFPWCGPLFLHFSSPTLPHLQYIPH